MTNTQSSPIVMNREQTQRTRLARTIILLSMVAASVVLVFFVNLLFTASQFLAPFMIGVILAFIVLCGISLWLIRRNQLSWAIMSYLLGAMIGLTVAIYLLGGVTGPVTVGLIITVVVAGLLGGAKPLRLASVVVAAVYLTLAILERNQVLRPERLPDASSWIIEIVFFLVVLGVTASVSGVFVGQTQQARAVEQQRSLELVQATHQAEALAMAEREAREREAHSAAHLRETVAGYVDYLSRVAAGDYTARVDVGELEEDVEGDRELHALGEYLNTTVDALVAALTQAQEVQRRYAEQTWQDVVASGRVQPGFAYRQNQITPEVEWLPQMRRAVDSGAAVAEGEGAAVPLVVNRQVVGALGGEHPDGRPWTDEELALIEDVTGQLAQTIESLRLFDDVQRRAVQEQLVGEITARIRASLTLEQVLGAMVQEVAQALGAEQVAVQLQMLG
ncbi:MAG: GAF domain-containing protein, partial [Anaerolineae bacterium]